MKISLDHKRNYSFFNLISSSDASACLPVCRVSHPAPYSVMGFPPCHASRLRKVKIQYSIKYYHMQDCAAPPRHHDGGRGAATLPDPGLLHSRYVQHSHSAATRHEHVFARRRCVCQGTQYMNRKKNAQTLQFNTQTKNMKSLHFNMEEKKSIVRLYNLTHGCKKKKKK